jgi:hypothetical protein
MDDDGELMYLGDSSEMDLQDDYSLQDNLQSVSMVPLQDNGVYGGWD